MLFRSTIIDLFLLIFLIPCSLSAEDTETTSPHPTTIPSTKEKIQRVVAFTEGITAIIEVFNSPEPVGRNLTKLLEGSRKCGLVLHAGLSFDGIENTPEVKKLFQKRRDLSYTATIISPSVVPFYTPPIINVMDAFTPVLSTYSFDNLSYFKGTCIRTFLIESLRLMSHGNLLINLDIDIARSDYTDVVYKNLKNTYENMLKQTIGLYPLCNIFVKGLPNASDQLENKNYITAAIITIHKKFVQINKDRKQKYWKNENIVKLIGKHIVEFYSSNGNYNLASALFEDLYRGYDSLGYNYHVIVSNAAQRGHNDTLIQCSTECHYLYNFLGKDVYVMRTKKSEKGYSSCEFLEQYPDSHSGYCFGPNYTNESLEPLAEEIAGNCTGVAFSLVRRQLDHAGRNGTNECKDGVYSRCVKEIQGFTSKCKDGINIVFANFPLKD